MSLLGPLVVGRGDVRQGHLVQYLRRCEVNRMQVIGSWGDIWKSENNLINGVLFLNLSYNLEDRKRPLIL